VTAGGGNNKMNNVAYRTINLFTEELVKTFREHTEAHLEAIIAKAINQHDRRMS
jgi:hypothetical protein